LSQIEAPAIESFRTTADLEPYEYYERLRELGGVAWDDELNGLLLGSYDVVRETLRQDTRRFTKEMGEWAANDPAFLATKGSLRDITLLHGRPHTLFHRWWLQMVSPTTVEDWRETRIRPVVERIIDRFAVRGRAELVDELAEQVPMRVIASLLGLPWEDDEWLESCRAYMDARMSYLEAIESQAANRAEVGEWAIAVATEFKENIRPFAERGPVPGGDDLITAFWTDGPTIFPDWNIEDVITGIMSAFFAGSDTTSYAVINGLYLLLTRPGLQDQLRSGGREAVDMFVEEALRIHGVAHLTHRVAAEDCDVGGVAVKKGTTVYPLLAAANLDPTHYDRPWEVDLNRPSPRDHTSFYMGRRSCGGMWLARGELAVMYTAVLERLRDLRLDPDKEPPRMVGFSVRAFRPLHALFTPANT
jgi:cytochrome P450